MASRPAAKSDPGRWHTKQLRLSSMQAPVNCRRHWKASWQSVFFSWSDTNRTGSAQIAGQGQGSDRDSQSERWAQWRNLRANPVKITLSGCARQTR
jgi:hypothetical protein